MFFKTGGKKIDKAEVERARAYTLPLFFFQISLLSWFVHISVASSVATNSAAVALIFSSIFICLF